MPLTNYPNGLSSFGMPLMGGGSMTLPLMGGSGKAFFVDPANGVNTNGGEDPSEPLDDVAEAHDRAVSGRGDVIYLLGDGTTAGSSRHTTTINWTKDNTHLIGLGAPTMLSQRARIAAASSVTSIITPFLKVTGNGCVFSNFSIFEGDDENGVASVGVEIENASRNYFWNVAIQTGSSANSADEAGSAALLLDGASENTFDSCYIGSDTMSRSAANANIRFRVNGSNTAARNVFRNCLMAMHADAATPLFIDADESGCIDRWELFDNCVFTNGVGSAATALTAATAVHASAGGVLIMNNCGLVGADDWHATDSTNIKLLGADPTDDGTGIAENVDVTP